MKLVVGLLILASLAVILAGCERVETSGPDAQGYRWVKDGPNALAVLHRGVDVYLNCSFAEHVESCAVQGRGDGLCHVYLPPDAPQWREEHEKKHCAGWRHPDPLRS